MTTRERRVKNRDDRDFDQTALREGGNHEQILHRDYSAHFFRWSFARRFIKPSDSVLEVGCGPDAPLWKLLFRNMQPHARRYVGVDLNKTVVTKHQHSMFLPEFNFVKDFKKVPKLVIDRFGAPAPDFDVAVNFEVIEHMLPEHGATLLKGIWHCLKPGGVLLLSTPCYDGRRHAANHIHEYTVPELQKAIEKAKFVVERRFGTFMDTRELKHIGRHVKSDGLPPDTPWAEEEVADALKIASTLLGAYYDNDALSCIFAPAFPNNARNNLWVCRKPS
jgi:SAM-dependent methyltransferase